ncbi:MAG: tetratricopeptide repeat protein, partial [Akkermansiaceae bacterium]|nr:tetratricopeptide repeat protein [Armatimonadota bacterium]
PLDLPGDDSDEFEWKQASSVRLFLDRAQAGEENFTVTTQSERDALTGLLRRLDGLPLAIELAASRIRYLSIGEIESRLAESLLLLSTRDTDVPERHRTLLATLEWSYGLLSEPEQRLLSHVCEFVGGFGADAAEQVMGGDPDTLDLLASLEEQSMLVCRRADKGEPPRFSLLQTVTDFVRMKRQESGMDGDAARESHANYFTQLAERNGGEMMTLSAMETESFDALDREMANLRATWSYLRERKDTERQAKLAANLSDFLRRRGHARERSAWIEAALETTKEGDLGFRLTYAHAMTLRDTGQVIEAEKVAGALQPLVAETGNAVRLADVLSLRGTIATRAKCYNEAEQFFDEALTLYQSADDKRGIGTLHSNRAVNALRMAEMERARTLLEMALTVCDGIADEQGKAYAHNNLGYLLSEKGEYSAAKRHYLYQLGYCRRHSDTMGCAVSLFNIGEAFLYDGHGNGLPLLIAAAEIFSRVGHPYAESAWADCEKWAEKTDMPRGIFAALRRGASRRTLAELRGSLRDG